MQPSQGEQVAGLCLNVDYLKLTTMCKLVVRLSMKGEFVTVNKDAQDLSKSSRAINSQVSRNIESF